MHALWYLEKPDNMMHMHLHRGIVRLHVYFASKQFQRPAMTREAKRCFGAHGMRTSVRSGTCHSPLADRTCSEY